MDTNKALTRLMSQNIRVLLTGARATQALLGEAVGVDQSQVSKWIRGQAIPNACQLVLISRYFRVSLDMLMSDDLSNKNLHDLESVDQILKIVETIGIKEAYRRLLVAKPDEPSQVQEASVVVVKPKGRRPVRKKGSLGG